MKPRILVIGAGVVGLTTALCARRAGYEVVIAADRFAPDITSVVAGALWEWPPAVCGHHRDEVSVDRSKAWCLTSYQRFQRLAEDAHSGVHVRPAIFYFRGPIEDNPVEHRKMLELATHVSGFRRDPSLADENGVSPSAKVADAYTHLAPMIDTDVYLRWLYGHVTSAGCVVVRTRIEGDLVAQQQGLLAAFGVDFIVNCAGLGAIELTGEAMYPLRGALVHAHNDGRTMPRITRAHLMAHDATLGGQNMVFIVPRGRYRLVLGGLVEPDQWNTDLTLDNHAPVREMLARCQEFLPALRDVSLCDEGTVRTGLRPMRRQGVRLGHQAGTRILHNVGHGGSGVTLSWGCAEEVVQLLDHVSVATTAIRP
ncbi:FAD-binding oxidoreductase [Lentzea tibetensis]|uniref:FAD-binding oxidoreductase n=1 Tax=Lentzea tibetensis TaxID=2591470 RepID=A0A563EPW8_9PSEU|nr:FAD-dependent oxidoreductase [Lentzea tibetensis]TWP49473.1 FAD-binding oxidoreductase [Lentzea tibetensis]